MRTSGAARAAPASSPHRATAESRHPTRADAPSAGEILNRSIRLAVCAFAARGAVFLLDEHQPAVASVVGADRTAAPRFAAALEILSHRARDGVHTLLVPDVRADAQLAPVFTAHSPDAEPVVALACALLAETTPRARCALIVFDSKPRTWSAADAELLRDLGDSLTAHLALQRELALARSEAAALQLECSRLREALSTTDERLRQHRDWLDLGLSAGHMGVFDWDVVSGEVRVTHELARLYGTEPSVLEAGADAWLSYVHPEDAPRIRETVLPVINGCQGNVVEFRDEFRILRTDGELRWLEVRGRVERDASGRAVRINGVHVDITERRRNAEALKEADRRKDEFLAMLAHELRNPLAPLMNSAHLLERLGGDDERLTRIGEMVGRQVTHMARLIDDLLDVSRVTRGKILLKKERLELAPIIHNAIETVRPLIESRRHRLTVSLPPAPLRVYADATRLTQVIGNLLDNAAKYTEDGGWIQVSAEPAGSEVVIRVRDNGMGISPELLPHVFELFTQDERSLDRAKGGLGIGLALVRSLVELHGGSVHAASAGPGLGSEFSVRLPAAGEPHSGGSSRTDEPTGAGGRCRVLVVDDNVDAAETLGLMLEMEGHQVRVAFEATQALEIARVFRPDIALLDIGMPGMDGYELAARMRAAPETRHTFLIAVTGYGQAEDRDRSSRAGFDRHLIKPVEPDQLTALIAGFQANRSR